MNEDGFTWKNEKLRECFHVKRVFQNLTKTESYKKEQAAGFYCYATACTRNTATFSQFQQ